MTNPPISSGPRSILFLSHTRRGGTFVVGSHHLARELSLRGHRVGHVSTPLSSVHRVLHRADGGRAGASTAGAARSDDGVLELVPRTLLPASLLSTRKIRSVLRNIGFARPDFVLIDQPKLARRGLFGPPTLVIYRPTDMQPSGMARAWQKVAVGTADALVVTSEAVLAALPHHDLPCLRLANGVEHGRFAAPLSSPRQGAVYVGALDGRFGWRDVVVFADHNPDLEIALYGPAPSAVPALPRNVRLRGPVSYQDLPAVLAAAKVGLLPLSESLANKGRSPIKLYEYLAAGLHVLATETPVTQQLVPTVATYKDPQDGAVALRKLVTLPVNRDGIEVSKAHDWSRKADELLRFLMLINDTKVQEGLHGS